MTNINLSEFDVVIIEQVGDTSLTTCYKNYTDYVKDKGYAEPIYDTTADLYGLFKQGENK